MLTREEMRVAVKALNDEEKGVRDEIGFLLLHQGFADRFFPGTSVLHRRVRYALFVPWLYRSAGERPKRGRDLERAIRDYQIDLANRLSHRGIGSEPTGVIGSEMIGRLTTQPPDQVYWAAMRSWGIVVDGVDSRSEALRRIRRQGHSGHRVDEIESLEEIQTEVFASSLPDPPEGWEDSERPLTFKLGIREKRFLQDRIGSTTRDDKRQTLLARLVNQNVSIEDSTGGLPMAIDRIADVKDKAALSLARDAADLAAIGRTVYGALVEELIAKTDGGEDLRTYRLLLSEKLNEYGDGAKRCDLDAVKALLPGLLDDNIVAVLKGTQDFVKAGCPDDFMGLLGCYRTSECCRKGSRARLDDKYRAVARRAVWEPESHDTSPLHYRWRIVSQMLRDLSNDT